MRGSGTVAAERARHLDVGHPGPSARTTRLPETQEALFEYGNEAAANGTRVP